MPSRTVRITPAAHRALREMAERRGRSMQDLLDEAVEALRRNTFLHEANRAFARLRKDRKAWREELQERRLWDRTLDDGERED